MITPAYGLTATERVLPRLALDWTTGLAQPGVDVVRAGVATYLDSDGLIKVASADTQRLDWLTGNSGLLVEESRSNALARSQELNFWPAKNVTIDANTLHIAAPDGTFSAGKITDNATSGVHVARISPATTVTANTTFTFSAFLEKGTNDFAYLIAADATFGRHIAAVANLNTGEITQTQAFFGTLSASSITSFPGGYFRLSITGSITLDAARFHVGLAPAASGNAFSGSGENVGISYVGTGKNIIAWGAQVELGSFPTSYIPTSGSAVTRNADVATMTGTNFSDWFNASEGAVFCETTPIALTVRNVFSINDGTNNESIYSYDTSTRYYLRVRTGAATQLTISSPPGTAAAGVTAKVVTAYKSANFGISANGATTSATATGSVPTGATRLEIAPSNNLHFRKFMYWPQRLTNNEVQAFCK